MLLLHQKPESSANKPSVHLLALVERVEAAPKSRGQQLVTAHVNLLPEAKGRTYHTLHPNLQAAHRNLHSDSLSCFDFSEGFADPE